ncbi:hypothetical protein DFP73DRAFT_530913 [Morchella snyderi]|nr:hypothetical protein DFP73DRAFT_530913 [Morchella snyderi]
MIPTTVHETTLGAAPRQPLYLIFMFLSFLLLLVIIDGTHLPSSPDSPPIQFPTTPRRYYTPTPDTPTYTCRTPTLSRPSPGRADVRLAALSFQLHAPKGDICVQDNKRFANWPWACVHLHTFGTASIGMCGPPGASLECEQVANMVMGIEGACVQEAGEELGPWVDGVGGTAVWGAGGSMECGHYDPIVVLVVLNHTLGRLPVI